MKKGYKIILSVLVVCNVLFFALLAYKAYNYFRINNFTIRKLAKKLNMNLYMARPPFYVFVKDSKLASKNFQIGVLKENIILSHSYSNKDISTRIDVGLDSCSFDKIGDYKFIAVMTKDNISFDYNGDGFFDAVLNTYKKKWVIVYENKLVPAKTLKSTLESKNFKLVNTGEIVTFNIKEGKFIKK